MFNKKLLEAVPTPTQVAIDRARAVLEECAATEATIAKLQIDRSGAVEAGNVDALVRINAELEIAQHILPKKFGKGREAVNAIYRAAAQVERELAEQKRASRQGILQKLTAALAELSEIECVKFTRYITRCQPSGVWERRFGMTPPDFDELGPGDCHPGISAVNSSPYAIPQSEKLAREIEAHVKLAAELAERQVDASGDLAAVLETVIRQVMPPPVAIATEAA